MKMKRSGVSFLLFGTMVGCGAVPMPHPSDLAATVESGGMHITWNPVGLPATDLIIERRLPGYTFEKLASMTTADSDYLDTKPGPAGTIYRVLAYASDQPLLGTYSKRLVPTY